MSVALFPFILKPQEFLSTSHTYIFGFFIGEYFECADAKVQRRFKI